MLIDHYQFGNITINHQQYNSDVIITPDCVYTNWWRKRGHNLEESDLKNVVSIKPEIMVIGTGYFGQMQVPQDTRQYLEGLGIKFEIAKTSEAVEKFNQLQKDCANIVAALHLTC